MSTPITYRDIATLLALALILATVCFVAGRATATDRGVTVRQAETLVCAMETRP